MSISRKQQTPEEVRDAILNFIRTKFYPEDTLGFCKDRPRLLGWVVLKLAKYLDDRDVTVTPERYRQIMVDVILMEAVRHGNTGEIGYPPAWLGRVVDKHLIHHGDEYYYEGKAARGLVEQVMLVAGKSKVAEPDTVRALAAAARLLKPNKPMPKAQPSPQLKLW